MGRLFRAGTGAAAACAGVIAMAAGMAAPAAAATWPQRPITLIVPFPPGGTTDIFARTIAEHMRPALGQSIVVENKPGAAGNLGVAAAARAQVLSLIHISEPTRPVCSSRMPSSA